MTPTTPTANASGTFTLGGDLTVNCRGFGAMRITGQGVWGEPADPACLPPRRGLDVSLIDTGDFYGPDSEEIRKYAE